MYLAELAPWLGWAALFGSLAVFVAFLILCLAVNVIVSREERSLEAAFGDEFREYKNGVPRRLL